jgi:hypothetical protein
VSKRISSVLRQFIKLCTVLGSVLGKVKDFLGEIAKANQKLHLDTEV